MSSRTDLSPDAAWQLLRDRPDLLVLDVRTPREHAAAHIPGARLIPVDELPGRLGEIPAGVPVLVHCAHGVRSQAACDVLAEHGHAEIYHMAGGLARWRGPVRGDKASAAGVEEESETGVE